MKIGNVLELRFTDITQRVTFSWLLLNMAINSFYAIVFWILWANWDIGPNVFLDHFGWWHLIGLLGISFMLMGIFFLNPSRLIFQLLIILIAMTIGTCAGIVLYALLYYVFAKGWNFWETLREIRFIRACIFFTLVESSIYGFLFYLEWISGTEDRLHKEKIKRLTIEKKAVESNLRALHAQIEPHFLFNTLSTILNLFDTDMERGKAMQKDLIRYLQSALPKIRVDETTIGQEMEMIRSYLNIFKVRMGDRLSYKIDVPDSLNDILLPPMLTQPLVENAIKHGIEPKIEGGEISIRADETAGTLRLEIADTGVGFHKGSGMNLGLTNIRERLKALYGNKGRLTLLENRPSGVKAVIEITYA